MNDPTICLIFDCDREARALSRTLCSTHYARLMKHGDTSFVTNRKGEKRGPLHKDIKKHLLNNRKIVGDCWVWTRAIKPNGYGDITGWFDGIRYQYVHRLAFHAFTGTAPGELQVDHTCHNRACFNPSHLRLATNKQNHENLKGARSDSKSGIRGAIWSSRDERYIATVWHGGKRHIAGYFKDPVDAGDAAAKLRRELFTHDGA